MPFCLKCSTLQDHRLKWKSEKFTVVYVFCYPGFLLLKMAILEIAGEWEGPSLFLSVNFTHTQKLRGLVSSIVCEIKIFYFSQNICIYHTLTLLEFRISECFFHAPCWFFQKILLQLFSKDSRWIWTYIYYHPINK